MTMRGQWAMDDAEPTITKDVNATIGSTSNPRTGRGCMVMATGFSGFGIGAYSHGTIVFGFANFMNAAATNQRSIEFREGATVHCGVGMTVAGLLTIYGPAGTVVATATTAVTASVHQYLEFKAIIADSGGKVEIRLGETVLLTYNGDTRNGGTGVCDGVYARAFGALASNSIDDVYLLDGSGGAQNDYQGDINVLTRVPNANGASSAWTGSDGNSVDNYLLVDDPAANTTDYVKASTSGLDDLYGAEDVPSTYTVISYRQTTWFSKSDAGTPPAIIPIQKGNSGGVRTEATIAAGTLSTTQQAVTSAINTTDPDGNALTPTRINAMQIGVRSA